jgi:hypothetical protein
VLQTGHKKSLASTIELSLSSPMFIDLGPHARGLLGVIAFFPQGVDENNLEWLFPTISNGSTIFDTFCVLSLTHRSSEFVTMLAPLRDYLCPKDPMTSSLLCIAKECYLTRMSTGLDRTGAMPGDLRWILSEDINVEHLLDVFTPVSTASENIWKACDDFMWHLYWQKPRKTVLEQKIERLPDDHPRKPKYLFTLSQLYDTLGNGVERKRFLTRTLMLNREREDDHEIAVTLRALSGADRVLGFYKQGIEHVKEAMEIFERLGETEEQAESLGRLGALLYEDKQFNAAEDATNLAIELLPGRGGEYLLCQSHRRLGDIYRSKGEREKAVHHFEAALGVASSFGWDVQVFWIHHSLAQLFSEESNFDESHTHRKGQIARSQSRILPGPRHRIERRDLASTT